MRKLVILFLMLLVWPLVAGAGETDNPVLTSPPDAKLAAQARAERLDRLFERLKQATNDSQARRVEQAILEIFRVSGSPTADVLVSRAMAAIAAGHYAMALDMLDPVIEQFPEFAEALSQRGTARFLMGDSDGAVFDFKAAIALEPRHFGALAGLGYALRDKGELKPALDALRAALALDPRMQGLAEAVLQLELKVERKV